MDPVYWGIEGAEVCEGFDHEDAEPLDVQHASEKLLRAADYFATQVHLEPMASDGPRRVGTGTES